MTAKRLKRPRDPIQLAKLIGDIATGQVTDLPSRGENTATVERAAKGGDARAQKLPAEKRKKIAQKAAKARWDK